MSHISISLKGTRYYRSALGIVAAQRDITIGQLVYDALEAQYGTEIAEAISKNFADSETDKPQPKRKSRKVVAV